MKPGPWKYALGVLLILVVVVLWVGSSFFVKYVIFGGVLNISNGNVSEDGYDIPYYLTYLCNSLFIVYLPIVGVKNLVVRSVAARKQEHRALTVTSAAPNDAHAAASKLLVDPADGQPTAVIPKGAAPTQSLSGLPSPLRRSSVLRHTMKWALIVCPFWFAANGTYNVSQGLTSVTSNSIISSTSGLFTFILSFFFTHETFTVVKLAGIFLSIGGACVVALKDSGEGSNDLLGDLVCLLSAFLYGCYTTLIDKGLPDDGQSQPALFFGFLGLFNAAIFGAGLALVYGLQWEKIQDVPLMIVGLILVKAAFDNVLSDYIWVRSMMLLSPTIATIGLTLTIPLSIIVDSALGTEQPDARTVVGAVLMVCGFVAVTYGKDPAFLASCCRRVMQPRRPPACPPTRHHPTARRERTAAVAIVVARCMQHPPRERACNPACPRCSGRSFADCRNARYSLTQSSSDDNEDDEDVAIDHTSLEEDGDDENDDDGAGGSYGDDTRRRRQ